MNEDPFRAETLGPADVRRIVRRAAALAEKDPNLAGAGVALTRDEVVRRLGDLGISEQAVERALRPDGEGDGEGDEEDLASADVSAKPSGFIGAPTRIVLEREVDGEPTTTQREDLVDALRSEVGESGTVETLGKTFAWHPSVDYRGRGRGPTVRVRSRDGRSRVAVEQSLTGQAVGLFVGIGVGAGVGPMGLYIMLVLKFGAIGLLAPLLWIPCMLLLARTIFGVLARRRRAAAGRVLRRVVAEASHWRAPAARVRVGATSPEDERARAADAEVEAETEAAAAATDDVRRAARS
ncbi:MAG TPA: hypothetical protein VGM56_05785 [Byssovorax sp.]|jgi:hypothetical protein